MTDWGLALSMGIVGGFVLGCREALLTLTANAFVQPGQYFYAYVSVPILLSMVFWTAVLAVVRLVGGIGRRSAAPLSLYAGTLGFGGTVSIAAPWASDVVASLAAVGESASWGRITCLCLLSAGFGAVAAVVVAAAASASAPRTVRLLRLAARTVLALGLVLLVPVARFVATDWKLAWTAAARPNAPGRPNLLLISIDTLRADHLGAYGDDSHATPNLDRLAADGVLFARAFTSAPWTLPAVASLHTGLLPHRHGAGAITNGRDPLGRSPLPPGTWTLAEALRDGGYETRAIVTNPYLARRYALDAGFDHYENLTIASEFFLAAGASTPIRLLHWLWPSLEAGDRGAAVSRRAGRFIQRARSPFFLWLHYIDPHPPYGAARGAGHKSFRGDTLLGASAPSDAFMVGSPDIARLRSGEIRLDAAEKDAVRRLYRSEVRRVDAAVGRVLDAVDRAGLRDDTLVVLVADHGEEFWEHGGVEHGHSVYDEVVRIPLLLRWPGRVARGARVDAVVRITDVAPTVLDLLGMPVPPDLDGGTVARLLAGQEEPPRVALIENMLFADERTGIRIRDRKYVRWEMGREEVYDLVGDPGELRDLAGIPAEVDPLRMMLADATARGGPAARAPDDDALRGPARAALRTLGYIQ